MNQSFSLAEALRRSAAAGHPVSYARAWAAVMDGRLRATREGRTLLVRVEDVAAFAKDVAAERQRRKAATTAAAG